MSNFIPFLDVLCDNTRLATKIEKTEYLETGDYIIIDQGKNNIAGYYSDAQGLYKDVPAIIFGDHTRIIKYVDKPCYIGADGVKLLGLTTKYKNSFDYKFLYYFLSNQNIPDTGYNRHFKWLKEVNILNVPLSRQKEIVKVLDKASELIEKRKEQLRELEALAESVFYDLFGDPVTNPKGWKTCKVIEQATCIVPGRDKPKSFTGDIPWITTADLQHLSYTHKANLFLSREEISNVKAKVIPTGSVIMTCVGDLGIISITGNEMVINQQLHAFICGDKISNMFLAYNLSCRKDYMYKMASSTTVPYMNKTICNNIPIMLPTIELQNQFAEIIVSIR